MFQASKQAINLIYIGFMLIIIIVIIIFHWKFVRLNCITIQERNTKAIYSLNF